MHKLLVGLLISVLGGISACAGGTTTLVPLTVERSAAQLATDTSQPTRLPSPEPTTASAQPLVIWFPDALAPLDSGDAAELLSAQISAFQNAFSDVFVELRLKRTGDVGGVMSTLRTAAPVAPGALPDLTLMRRADLISAQQSGLIHPISDDALPGVFANYPAAVEALARVEGALFGVPYMIDVRHLALRADAPITALSFDDVFTRELSFVFPAGRVTSMSETFLAQYRAARAEPSDLLLPIDLDALFVVFTFYDEAVTQGLISPTVTDFTQSADYLMGLSEGEISAGVVTSSSFMRLQRSNARLTYAPIPTESGELVTVIDGWVWVLTTADAARQTRALRFVNWMLDADRQSTYGQAADLLPAQRTALRQWDDVGYVTFIENLLDAAAPPIIEAQEGAAARILQSAFTSVVNDARTPAQAVNDVITQLPE